MQLVCDVLPPTGGVIPANLQLHPRLIESKRDYIFLSIHYIISFTLMPLSMLVGSERGFRVVFFYIDKFSPEDTIPLVQSIF